MSQWLGTEILRLRSLNLPLLVSSRSITTSPSSKQHLRVPAGSRPHISVGVSRLACEAEETRVINPSTAPSHAAHTRHFCNPPVLAMADVNEDRLAVLCATTTRPISGPPATSTPQPPATCCNPASHFPETSDPTSSGRGRRAAPRLHSSEGQPQGSLPHGGPVSAAIGPARTHSKHAQLQNPPGG